MLRVRVFFVPALFALALHGMNMILSIPHLFYYYRALQLPPEAWLRISLHHGSITWVTIRPSGRVTLRTLGDSGFMPPAKITSA